MEKTKVLLSIHIPVVRHAVCQLLSREVNVEIVGEAAGPIDAMVRLRKSGADVLIHSWREGLSDTGVYSHLFAQFPETLILGICPDQEAGYSVRPIRSMEGLIGQVRGARLAG